MIRVSILALRNAVMASIADARQVFEQVNTFLAQAGQAPAFRVYLVADSPEVSLQNGLFRVKPDLQLEEAEETDLVIIPALGGDMMSATHQNREYGGWIARQYKQGSEVASLCCGSFLLAFSGLLKGKQCTTHWAYANEFRHYYPSVSLVEEKLITDQQGLYTSGGSNAWWNLLLYLVEKYTDRHTAIRTAKYFMIDIDRQKQSPFVVFSGLKDHEDEVIKNAQEFIEANYSSRLTVDQIAARFNVTRRTFERRFRKATFITVVDYIQRVKIEAAKKELESGRKSVLEVMLDVGYSDIQTFRDVFKRVTDMTPVDYRNKYTK